MGTLRLSCGNLNISFHVPLCSLYNKSFHIALQTELMDMLQNIPACYKVISTYLAILQGKLK